MTLVYGSVYLSPKRDRGETMSHLQFAKGISRLGTESAFVVLSRAQKLAAEGHDIINLGIGQPDFRTPEHIVQAGIQALKDGHHGLLRLRPWFWDWRRRWGVISFYSDLLDLVRSFPAMQMFVVYLSPL